MKNVKYKAILSFIYSAGLRISEVINLPIKTILGFTTISRIEPC